MNDQPGGINNSLADEIAGGATVEKNAGDVLVVSEFTGNAASDSATVLSEPRAGGWHQCYILQITSACFLVYLGAPRIVADHVRVLVLWNTGCASYLRIAGADVVVGGGGKEAEGSGQNKIDPVEQTVISEKTLYCDLHLEKRAGEERKP